MLKNKESLSLPSSFPPPQKRNQEESFFNKHFSGNLMNTFEWLSLFPVPFLLNWSDKGLIWECFYLKELFLSDTSFGPAWVQDFLLLMQFAPSGPFLILVISKNVRIHLLLEVPFLWLPIWIGAYILTFPAEFMAVIVYVLLFVCIFQGLFNAHLISGFKLIYIRFFFFCVHYASAFQGVFL